jgi:hypothetical protein
MIPESRNIASSSMTAYIQKNMTISFRPEGISLSASVQTKFPQLLLTDCSVLATNVEDHNCGHNEGDNVDEARC